MVPERLARIATALVALLALALSATAAERRVDGPETLAAALRSAAPGDVLLLAPGDYGELTLAGLTGATGSPVVLRAADPAAPPRISRLTLRDSAFVTLDGLVFDYVWASGDPPHLRPFRLIGAQHVAILNAVFDGDRPRGVSPTDDGFGTAFGLSLQDSERIEIRGNEIRDFFRGLVVSRSAGITVACNEVHTIRMDGMNFAQVDGVVIEGNHIHGFNRSAGSKDHADMIQFWTNGTTAPSRDIVIRGNVLNSGNGLYTQSIFMRNDQVDRGLAGSEMFYRDITIEENVIVNAHLHGISVGETDGLRIANNTVIRNARSEGQRDNPGLWTPQIRVSEASRNVIVTRNVAPAVLPRTRLQRDWQVSDNLEIQDISPRRGWFYDDLFVAARTGDPEDLDNFRYLPGGPLDDSDLGAARLRGFERDGSLRPQCLTDFAKVMPGGGAAALANSPSANANLGLLPRPDAANPA